MRIDILTLFPEVFLPLKSSILERAEKKNLIQINILDIRDFSKNKHKKCDDYIFGGGSGMLMTAQPVADCINSIDKEHKGKRIYLSPSGKTFNQNKAKELAENEFLILLCGHYEGIDQRIIDLFIDEEISIGDYILTGGEIPAMVLTDCICRNIEGVIKSESLLSESFSENLLEYPQYTRPEEFMGIKVPEVLLSGNHAEVAKWRKEQALEKTKKLRPDLLSKK